MKTLSIKLISLFLLIFFVTQFSLLQAEDSEAKKADIKKLLQLTKSGELGIQAMNQMIGTFKTTMPSVPEKFWEDFMKEIKADDLVNLIVPIYEKHFTHDDIKGLIAFYETPVGQKFIQTQPAIAQESMEAGQKWGQELGMKVAQKLKEGGYTK